MARVMVVEDDPTVRTLVASRLQKAGHRTREASDAASARLLLDDGGRPDVVVLDVMLPDGTGLDLLTEIRTRAGFDALPAIFLSARVSDADIAAGRALNAAYLTKPFVAGALIAAVDRAIEEIGLAAGEW